MLRAGNLMGVALEVLTLPSKRKSFVFDDLTLERINKLASRLSSKTETEILKDALIHFLGTIERDQPVWPTAPSEVQKSNRSEHKEPR